MRAVDVIRKKRDGGTLTPEEIAFFIEGATKKTWEPYQVSALLMAIVWRGLDDAETAELTACMVCSGTVLDWSEFGERVVDKHSAGGVGDKTSLVLVPLAAACGCKVPKMSGRGLAHTGGTLDKLEAIPGYRINLSPEEFHQAVSEVGCALVGQTANLAPADKVLYALRDVTATVESIPLIAASIMSKKLAEGIRGVVLDVKTGHGAFMKTLDDARRLAHAMVAIGTRNNVRTVAMITDMDQPLGQAIGNSLEVAEAVMTLRSEGPKDLETLSCQLAAWLVVLSGQTDDLSEAEARVREALHSGKGLAKFREMVVRQGGDPLVIDDPAAFESMQASRRVDVRAGRAGFITAVDAEKLGRTAMLLGAGRERTADVIDHAVGVVVHIKPGAKVDAGTPLVTLHYRRDERLAAATQLVQEAYAIGPKPPTVRSLVLDTITS
jgi:pyrimidine-nucleoside phosphorylase